MKGMLKHQVKKRAILRVWSRQQKLLQSIVWVLPRKQLFSSFYLSNQEPYSKEGASNQFNLSHVTAFGQVRAGHHCSSGDSQRNNVWCYYQKEEVMLAGRKSVVSTTYKFWLSTTLKIYLQYHHFRHYDKIETNKKSWGRKKKKSWGGRRVKRLRTEGRLL